MYRCVKYQHAIDFVVLGSLYDSKYIHDISVAWADKAPLSSKSRPTLENHLEQRVPIIAKPNESVVLSRSLILVYFPTV